MNLQKAKGNLTPRWIWFEVTDRCNSHCMHCNIWRKKPSSTPMTISEIERTFNNPLFSKLEYILNSGGEAVLREDIEDILLVEHKILPQAKLHLSTNGILAERVITVVNTMIKNNIPIEIGISLDAMGEEHDRIRGTKDNFQKTKWLIEELVILREKNKNKVSPLIGLTLSSFTKDTFKDVKEYAEKIKVPFTVQWYNQSSFYENCGKADNDQQIQKEIAAIIRSLPSNILNTKWLDSLSGRPIKFPCFALRTFCVLKCNGDIVPCLSLWDKKTGNVKEQDPMKIWISPEAENVRRCVKNCEGCLNGWGVYWSIISDPTDAILFYLKRPYLLFNKIKESFRNK